MIDHVTGASYLRVRPEREPPLTQSLRPDRLQRASAFSTVLLASIHRDLEGPRGPPSPSP